MRGTVARTLLVCALLVVGLAGATASPTLADAPMVGTSFPDDFPVVTDASLGTPVIGFGGAGPITRTPVIFLHGNNETPFPTTCNGSFGEIHNFAQHFADHGYALSELWGLGYQGDQCDTLTDPTIKSGETHSTVANVPDLRAFVHAVLGYTGADQVDVVGHSLGTTLTREWMRQDDSYHLVRTLIGVDGPNHGIINCSPDPANYYALDAAGGFGPDSAICVEYGASDTPFLRTLNAVDETPGPTRYVMIVNADVSFVYVSAQDGVFPPVPSQNRRGEPEDFSRSARLEGAQVREVTDQGRFDDTLGTAHIGIVNSPEVWALALEALTGGAATPPPSGDEPSPPPAAALPATGGGLALLGLLLMVAATRRRPPGG